MTSDSGTGDTPHPDPAVAPSEVNLLREAQAIAQLGSWRHDLQTGNVNWSPEMFAVYGRDTLPSRDTPGECQLNLVPEDHPTTAAAFADLLGQQTPMDIVHRVQHPDGSLHYVQVRGRLTVDAQGRPVSAQGTAQDVTAQRLRETALRSSEAYLRTVFATMVEGLVTQDRDGRVIDANDAALTILGLSRDELLGRTSIDPRWRAVREDGSDWPGTDHPGMVALRTGEPQRRRVMGVIAPGQGRRWISINATPLRSGPGATLTGVVATFADITADVEQRHRLEASNAELADLYDHAPCGYHSLDANGRFLRINDTGLAWFGVTREQAIGKLGPADFFRPDSRHEFTTRFPRIRAGEQVDPFELDLVSRSGHERRVRADVSVIRDARGHFVATRTVMHDITELHRTRVALEQLTREQLAMLDTELIGLTRVKARRFAWVSAGMTAMFGYLASELIGQPTRMLFADDADHDRMGALAFASRAAANPLRAEFRMVRRDGSAFWLDIGVAPVPGTTDELTGRFVDITAAKDAESARQRAVELDSENTRLRETDGLKSQFLSNMSHELRTPLNAVIGLAHLLESGFVKPESPKYLPYLAQIGASGRHLTQLLDTMLGYASLEAKRLELHPEPVDLLAAVQDALHTQRAGRTTDGTSIGVTVADEVRTVVVDALRLRQVLVCLIDNAVKFSPPAGRVEVRASASGATHVRIDVQDFGIGIAEADLPRLFGPLVQLSSGLTKTHAGIGMGLALVRRIVLAQGGSVGVESTLGAGSTFHIILPRRPAPAG